LTASVTLANGQVPSGSVRFTDNGVEIGTSTLSSSGKAVLSDVRLRIGGRRIVATFTPSNPQAVAGSASSQLSIAISAAATTTTLNATQTATASGATVTVEATVKAVFGAAAFGTVTFKNGATVLGTASVNGNGVARLTLPLAFSSYSVQAFYSGSSTATASQSATKTVVVSPVVTPVVQSTTTKLTASTNSLAIGQSVRLTARVKAANGAAVTTGQVQFFRGSILLGTLNLDSYGQASWTVNGLGVGSYGLRAVYVGTSNFLTSTSTVATVTVSKQATRLAFVTPPTSGGLVGEPVTVQLRVTPAVSGSPIGTVTLTINSAIVGTAKVDGNGMVKLTFPTGYNSGLGSIRFLYSGSSTFESSTLDLSR